MKSLIIRMPNWLGDAVMATPLLHDLKVHFPDTSITVMCLKGMDALFVGNPYVDEIFTFSKPNTFLHRLEHRDLIGRLRQGKWDIGILLPNSFSSAWWFFRGGVKERIGFKRNGRSFLLTKGVSVPVTLGKEHLVTTYKRLLAPLSIALSVTSPSLYVLDEERKAVDQLLSEYHIPKSNKLIGLNPGAAFGPAKCWPKERYRALAQKLLQENADYSILVFGDHASFDLCNEITRDLGGRIINLAGRTNLRQLIAFIERIDLLITNDSGPMHMAAALQTPLLALFGSTSDVATGPYKHGQVLHKHVACSPCFKRECPIDFRCMTQISVDEVYHLAQLELK